MWYSNYVRFPFQEKSKRVCTKSAFRRSDAEDLDDFTRTCSGWTSEDGQAESEHDLEGIRR